MKKSKLIFVALLFSVCLAAAAGCGLSSSGTVADKLPIDNNMPIQNGSQNGETPKPDEKPEPPPEETEKPVENIVIFIAEDYEYSVSYNAGDTSVQEPSVPEKRGYSGKWPSYDLQQGGKITVTAEYELIRYQIIFTAGETQTALGYTIFDNEVTPPQIPQIKGYTAEWESFTLSYGEPVTVSAVYSIIHYNIYFPVGGENVLRTYTVEDDAVDEPSVPHKTGYVGKWSYGELTFGGDMYAEAVYTPIPSTAGDCFKWKLNANSDGYIITEYTGSDTEVVIPSEHDGLPVTEIYRYAFFGNTEITGIIITENVTAIGNYVFSGCTSLKSVELPSTLRTIGLEAFSHTAITEIELPENLVKIGRTAFKDCTALETAVFRNDTCWYEQTDTCTPVQFADGKAAAQLLVSSLGEFYREDT